MHSRYTWIRWRKKKKRKKRLHSQHTGPGIILESPRQNTILCLFTETKWQTFRGIPGFYSTSGAVDYTAVIFCAHLVAMKCEVFTTTSTRGIQLYARPATQLTCSPLPPADFTRQSIAHARESKWKGSNRTEYLHQGIQYHKFWFYFVLPLLKQFQPRGWTTAIPFSKGYLPNRPHACRKSRTALLDLSLRKSKQQNNYSIAEKKYTSFRWKSELNTRLPPLHNAALKDSSLHM